MADRKPNETKIVAWLLVAKKLIKFANDETSYKIGDKVMAANDFTKYPLTKGDKVEVGIQEGVVTFLRKQKSESKGQGSEEAYEPTPEEEAPKVAPAPTPKVEAPKVEAPKVADPTVAGEIKELTIHGVAANKKVVKFSECKEAGWFQIAEDIQAQNYNVIGLIAKNKVRVQIVENKIISLALVSEATEQAKTPTSSPETAKVEPTAAPAVQTPTQAPKKEWKPASSYDTAEKQTSIECQAMINSACDVVGRVAANVEPKPTASVINSMIRAVAESNYQLLQELKKK
jgi:hypothetical protein